jgi:cell division protein FtsW (lipid II flippase)
VEQGELEFLPDRHTDFVFTVSASPWLYAIAALVILAAVASGWRLFSRRNP